jgi:putative transposase
MKRGRFSEEQIIAILKEAESGAKVTELCRRHGVSDATFYTWRSKYGGLEVSEMRRLRQLEEENRRLKSIVADQALDLRALKDVLAKTATARGEAADGSGSNDHPRAVAASRLWADRDHATRVPARAGGRPQPRVAATLA